MAESVKDAQLSLPLRVPLKSGINTTHGALSRAWSVWEDAVTAGSMCSSLPLQLNKHPEFLPEGSLISQQRGDAAPRQDCL